MTKSKEQELKEEDKCPRCNGKGYHHCYHKCSYCGDICNCDTADCKLCGGTGRR